MTGAMSASQRLDRPTLDPELSFIASQAAIELDNLLLRNDSKFSAVVRLAEYLRQSSSIISGTRQDVDPLDPQTVDVVSRAIDASGVDPIKTLDDFRIHAGRIATDLRDTKDDSDESKIERLRSFCIALSQVAAAQRQTIMDMHPSHPFRE